MSKIIPNPIALERAGRDVAAYLAAGGLTRSQIRREQADLYIRLDQFEGVYVSYLPQIAYYYFCANKQKATRAVEAAKLVMPNMPHIEVANIFPARWYMLGLSRQKSQGLRNSSRGPMKTLTDQLHGLCDLHGLIQYSGGTFTLQVEEGDPHRALYWAQRLHPNGRFVSGHVNESKIWYSF